MLDFMAPSLSVVNLESCELNGMGHHPKMFLYMLDELMYIYNGLGNDYDGQQIIAFEILSLVWEHYCRHKHSCQAKNLARGDAMKCLPWGLLVAGEVGLGCVRWYIHIFIYIITVLTFR